jgi:hypothetical protein
MLFGEGSFLFFLILGQETPAGRDTRPDHYRKKAMFVLLYCAIAMPIPTGSARQGIIT